MLIGLILTTYQHKEYGIGCLNKYIHPPIEYGLLYKLLPEEIVYPFFDDHLLMILKRAYFLDHALATKVFNDLRLRNTTDYLGKVLDDPDYDPTMLLLINKIRLCTAPSNPYQIFANQLCSRLNFTFAN
jgi:hypothetical protein